ncbi:hypothetical protein D3C83_153850 [compost metagenome]
MGFRVAPHAETEGVDLHEHAEIGYDFTGAVLAVATVGGNGAATANGDRVAASAASGPAEGGPTRRRPAADPAPAVDG